MFSFIQKYTMVFVFTLVCLFFTGCSGSFDNMEAEIQTRMAHNIAQVDKLREAGLISNELSNKLKESINSQSKRLSEMATAFNDEDGSVWGSKKGIKEFNRYGTWAIGPLTSFIELDGTDKSKTLDGSPIYWGDLKNGDTKYGSKESYDILSIDDKALEELESVLDLEIYVLKRDPLGTGNTVNDYVTLDDIAIEVEKAQAGKQSKIDQYFVSTGKKVWDKTLPENQIIKDSVQHIDPRNARIGCHGLDKEYTLLKAHNVLQDDLVLVQTEYCDHGKDKGGHNILLNAVGVRLREFNDDAISRLVGKDGVNKNKYVVVGNRAYLMEYPITVVSGFKVEGTIWEAEYEEVEDFKVNILTGKMYGGTGKEMVGYDGNNFYSVLGGGNTEGGKASFVVDGVKGKPTKEGFLNIRDKKEEVNEDDLLKNKENYGRVVLRDYKELSYLPGLISGEDMVALGRTVRINKFKGDGNTELGVLVGINSVPMTNSYKIRISDVMDLTEGLDVGSKNKLSVDVISTGDEAISGTTVEVDSSDDVSGVQINGGSHSLILKTNFVTQVKTSTKIPGDKVATGDTDDLSDHWGLLTDIEGKSEFVEVKDEAIGDQKDENNVETEVESTNQGVDGKQKQVFFGMALDLDPFTTNMFSGWVNVSGETEEGSLDYWNNWLSGTTYNYYLDRNEVIEYFMGNYVTELQDEGYVVLDLDTIGKIQQEMLETSDSNTVGVLTVTFVILGYLLIFYAILLPLAWLYDVNVTIGISLLGVLTFNRWVASSDELPDVDNSKRYMSLNATIFAAIKIVILGLVLVSLDIGMIVNFLVMVFGGVSKFLGDLFLN